MSTSWMALALASTAMAALVNTFDSHFITRRMPGLRSYLLVIGAFTIMVSIALLIIFPLPGDAGLQPVLVAIVSAIARVAGLVLLLYAMKREDIARVIPLGSTGPIFTAVMAVLFLGEHLNYLQWLAVATVVIGAILISFKRGGDGTHRFQTGSFFILLGASLLLAVSDVANKHAMSYLSYWNIAGLSFFITALVLLLISLRRGVVKQISAMPRPVLTSLGVILNEVASIVATVLGFWAIQLGPVSLVSTVLNSKPLFVLLFAILLGWLMPGFLLDGTSDRQGLALKLVATIMIVGGIAIIFLA